MDAKILKKGRLFESKDKKLGKIWIIAPFLCKVSSDKVKLDHENTEYRWIIIKDILKHESVPGLQKDLKVLGLF